MSENVSISADGYILVVAQGQPSVHELAETLAEIALLHERHGIDKVLVDGRGRTSIPGTEDSSRGAELLGRLSNLGIRFAIVTDQDQIKHEFFRFLAQEYGATIKYFGDINRAKVWLATDESG
jgi:hypothetical protein